MVEASHPGPHRLASSSEDEFLVHEELLDSLQQDLLPGSRRRVRRRIRDNDSEDALIRDGESPEVPSQPTEPRTRRLVLVSSSQVDPVPPTVPDSVDGPHRRRRRVRSKGLDFGPPAVVGGAIHHDLTLIDSSDDDAPFIVPRSAASPARPSLKPPHSRSRTEEVWRHRTLNPTLSHVLAPGMTPAWLFVRNLSVGCQQSLPLHLRCMREVSSCHNHQSSILGGSQF